MSTPAERSRRRAMIAVGLSTIVELYDFTLCLYFAPTLARIFFGTDQHELAAALICRQEGLQGMLRTH